MEIDNTTQRYLDAIEFNSTLKAEVLDNMLLEPVCFKIVTIYREDSCKHLCSFMVFGSSKPLKLSSTVLSVLDFLCFRGLVSSVHRLDKI